ncbi:MAG: hypothetical protein ABIP12_05725, partial [Terriglobales bacterium]
MRVVVQKRLSSLAVLLVILAVAGCGSKSEEPVTSTDSSGKTTTAGGKSPGLIDRMTAKPITVPAGTVITVRLGEAVGSKLSQDGQSFSATVAQPVEVGGKVVIPSGAAASGTVVTAKPLGRFKGGAVLQVRLDSVTVGGKNYALDTADVTRSLQGKEGGAGEVRAVAFSPDGKRLAAGNRYGTVRVWDVASTTEVTTLTGHASEVWSIAFSPDGRTLAAVDTDWKKASKIKLWDTTTWKERGSLAMPGEILCLAYSPKGDWLAAGSWDKTVRLFPISSENNLFSGKDLAG